MHPPQVPPRVSENSSLDKMDCWELKKPCWLRTSASSRGSWDKLWAPWRIKHLSERSEGDQRSGPWQRARPFPTPCHGQHTLTEKKLPWISRSAFQVFARPSWIAPASPQKSNSPASTVIAKKVIFLPHWKMSVTNPPSAGFHCLLLASKTYRVTDGEFYHHDNEFLECLRWNGSLCTASALNYTVSTSMFTFF